MQQMKVEESEKPKKSGCFLSNKVITALSILIAAILTASILITYFAKPNQCGSSECQSLVCKNFSLLSSDNFENNSKI